MIGEQSSKESEKRKKVGFQDPASEAASAADPKDGRDQPTPSKPSIEPQGWPMSMSLVDTKLVNKPKPFSGNSADWRDWKFKMTSYLGCLDLKYDEDFEAIENDKETDYQSAMADVEEDKRSRVLFHLLASMTEGKALLIVKQIRE